MRVRQFLLNSDQQVVVKIEKEVLQLFKIVIGEKRPGTDGRYEAVIDDCKDCDIEFMQITNQVNRNDSGVSVQTHLKLVLPDGSSELLESTGDVRQDEREQAGIHRVIKLNFYKMLLNRFDFQPALWGILHGVRPTKIVHRYMESGLGEAEIMDRLLNDYAASYKKAECITKLAYRQKPFLETSDEKTVSIYVGIPFCLSKCLYCSFPSNVLPVKNPEKLLDSFMAVWKKDLESVVEAVKHYGFRVQNIYIGGGTPTSLPDSYFAEMIHLVYNAFYGPDICEFTVEAGRPDSMTPAKIRAMVEHHVTRVSANPQTMQERTLKFIGRSHTPDQVIAMVNDLKKAGIPSINMDLIVGLPGESEADMHDTMQKVIALNPDDITLHALALKRGSRLKLKLDEAGEKWQPEDEVTQNMFDIAMDYVEKAGMKPYYLYRQGYMAGDLENVGCCRPGGEGMYNIQIMEEHQTILGIGASATSKIVDFQRHRMKSSFNAKDLATYLRDVDIYIEKRNCLLEEAYGN